MCTKPLGLVNPRYKKMAKDFNRDVYDYRFQEDYIITVPCGHCDECLKKRQQQWFSRADHLVKRMNLRPDQCFFCTFTLKPEVYEAAKEKPYLPIRRFLDRLRKHPRFRYRDPVTKRWKYRKVKFPYFFVVEFADGSRAAERGLPSTHRMHYHAILFNPPLYWWQIRDLWEDFNGIADVQPLRSMAGVRYVLKYMTKDRPECQFLSSVDAKKNGKLVVSHGFGRLSKEDIRILREHMLKSRKSWFCHYIGNYAYSIPRYWREACFSKEYIRLVGLTLRPFIVEDMVKKKYPYPDYSFLQQRKILESILWL